MKLFPKDIVDRTVYPVVIRNAGRVYRALYCYTKSDDALINDGKNVLCFWDEAEIRGFCEQTGLRIEWIPGAYDFDEPIGNPIRYSTALDRWNLLNTIAGMFGLYFEGDLRKYTRLYEVLFQCSTWDMENPPDRIRLSQKEINQLKKVFRKKERYLKRFRLYDQ